MRKATIKKNKSFKFGQNLKKGEQVLIEEVPLGRGRTKFTAFRPDNKTLGMGVTRSEFEFTEKEKFIVSVTRTSYSTKNIEVEAIDKFEAERLAIDEAGNLEFSEDDAEYSTNATWAKKEHQKFFK